MSCVIFQNHVALVSIKTRRIGARLISEYTSLYYERRREGKYIFIFFEPNARKPSTRWLKH